MALNTFRPVSLAFFFPLLLCFEFRFTTTSPLYYSYLRVFLSLIRQKTLRAFYGDAEGAG